MKIAVVSYSLTGNNELLAAKVAKKYSADHIRITETKQRTNGKIFIESLFDATMPKVSPEPSCIDSYDLVVFISPVWIKQVASPLRAYLRHVKNTAKKYAFFSISGGALGPNPKLQAELKKRTGAAPAVFNDMHIADLLPQNKKPTMKDTSYYHLSSSDAEKLAGQISDALLQCTAPA